MPPAAATILRLFRESRDSFVSGAAISRELQISRTAVWKHVNALRSEGYVIEAVPSRGYQLVSAPDILNESEVRDSLNAKLLGSQLICLSETLSTNSDAFRLAEEGAPEGTVVIADSQSGGKGRMGRRWVSPANTNLYCSVVLRPAIMPYQAPQLTFLSAVAVSRAIEVETALQPEIKWPNDVLIEGSKVAGLLNEMSAETDGINFVILGIGVNLNMRAEQFPDDLRSPATSLLLASGRRVCRARFAATVLGELDRLYLQFLAHGFGPVREEWQQRCNARGRDVAVSDGGSEMLQGAFAGIDADGALLVRLPGGTVERILSGDVRIV